MSDVIEQLRKECEDLGIKWHSRHSEDGLRKLIAEADVADDGGNDPLPEGYVQVKITKWGAGKVSNGAGGFFERGETVALPEKSAWQLDAKHYAEAD